MKLNVSIDLDDMWFDNDSLGAEIRRTIKDSIQAAVRKEVNFAVKDVLADSHKEIKAAAKQYGKLVLSELLKKEAV